MKKKKKYQKVVRAYNLSPEVSAWLDKKAEKDKTNLSAFVDSVLQEKMQETAK